MWRRLRSAVGHSDSFHRSAKQSSTMLALPLANGRSGVVPVINKQANPVYENCSTTLPLIVLTQSTILPYPNTCKVKVKLPSVQ